MKQSRFSVGRKLTRSEWGELKAWRTDNPKLRFTRGDLNPEGRVFWGYHPTASNGEQWVSLESFSRKKAAAKERLRKWVEANGTRYKIAKDAWYVNNKQRVLESSRAWRASNPDRAREVWSAYYRSNLKRIAARNAGWAKANQEQARAARLAWRDKNRPHINRRLREKRSSDPLFNVASRLRSRTAAAISSKGFRKTSKMAEMLGCSWPELMTHLERQFKEGMSWENRSLWHIDHIVPLASARTEKELVALCHHTNLQPLWAADNLRKGDQIL